MLHRLIALLTTSRLRVPGVLALLGFFTLCLVVTILLAPRPNGTPAPVRDFHVFWATGMMTRTQPPALVYDTHALTATFDKLFPEHAGKRALGFLYPPPTLLLLSGLSFFSPEQAYLGFSLIILGAFSLLALLYAGPAGVILVWGFPGLAVCLNYGQISLALTLLLGLATLALSAHPRRAGVLAGLCIIKPQLGLLIGVAALGGKHGRVIATAVLTILILCLITALCFPGIWPAAMAQGLPNATEPLGSAHWLSSFVSLFAYLRLQDIPLTVAIAAQILAALSAVALTFHIFRKTTRSDYRLLALGLLPLWVTPFAYQYDTVIQLLAVLALMRLCRQEGLMPAELLALFFLYLLPLWAQFSVSTPHTLLLQMLASATLIACLLLRVRAEPATRTDKVHT